MSSDAVQIEGTVVKRLPGGVCWVELSNGHRLVGHVSRRLREQMAGLAAGDRVTLEMSPFDFSKGRITERRTGCGGAQAPTAEVQPN